MSAPKYTGNVLTESDLRAFSHCPRYYSFGGGNLFPPPVGLLRLATEKVISNAVRSDKLDPTGRHMKSLLQASKELGIRENFMDSQAREMEAGVGIALGELFNAFAAHKFLPIFGPAPWRVKLSKSVIQLQTSGILRSNDKTLHFVEFSPYQTIHGLRNDPIAQLKIHTVKDFAKPLFKEKKVVVHVFSINEKLRLIYSKNELDPLSPLSLERIERQIKAFEQKHDSPILPCPYQCPYKHKCYLENE